MRSERSLPRMHMDTHVDRPTCRILRCRTWSVNESVTVTNVCKHPRAGVSPPVSLSYLVMTMAKTRLPLAATLAVALFLVAAPAQAQFRPRTVEEHTTGEKYH